MRGRILTVLAAFAMAGPALANADGDKGGDVAGSLFRAGQQSGQTASAYAHWMPIGFLQKADLVEEMPDDGRFEAYGADGKLAQLDFGYGYREFRLLWMPFLAWPDGGWVFFSRTSTGQYSLAPAMEIEMMRVERMLGRDPRKAYSFNPLWHMWGWLSLIPLIFAWRRYRRWDDARREAAGMM